MAKNKFRVSHKQLDRMLKRSEKMLEIPFNSESKIVIVSDCHRGDGTGADRFMYNKEIYKVALKHYVKENFTYIEAGDGDELWVNRGFQQITKEHSDIFVLLRQLYLENRLILIYGNHDGEREYSDKVEETLYSFHNTVTDTEEDLFRDIKVHETVKLIDAESGIAIYVFHGHQADPKNFNPAIAAVINFFSSTWYRNYLLRKAKEKESPAENAMVRDHIDKSLATWGTFRGLHLITGHTHHPIRDPGLRSSYCNCGSSLGDGNITCVELEKLHNTLVRWKRTNNGRIIREVIKQPKPY